ncbi:hypothetical protein CC80DRAFT_597116 [Byssothecium circinans]|uniref:S-adenosyl-L-methionine-dependent methyltransferase n=1 Tax=Byssothecium circinans TaxID=147558 RepID=A0A6A5TLF2_9PLEO|nr:hypothetical protein CC80DRAFT_597116 [Byssothecium circinans]
MDAILDTATEEVHRVAQTIDDGLRRRTIDKLRSLQYPLETPKETKQRLIYAGLHTASIRVGLDLKIFNKLVEADRPLKLDELAETTGADSGLLVAGRILRHQASLGMIRETSQDTFTDSQTTRNLSNADIQAGLKFSADVLDPAYAATPSFLAARSYRNPTDLHDTPFNTSWATELTLWDWLAEHPEHRTHFNAFMNAQRSSVKDCFSILAPNKEVHQLPAEKPFFVDPDMNGKVVLQDLPSVVNDVKLPEGIDVMAYNFFTKREEILKNIVDAMTQESTLLLDEIVVLDENVDWFVT